MSDEVKTEPVEEPPAKRARPAGDDAAAAAAAAATGTAAAAAPAAASAAAAAADEDDEKHRPPNYVLKYTCEGHDNSLSSLKFSPDGKWLASACKHSAVPFFSSFFQWALCARFPCAAAAARAPPEGGVAARCSGGQDDPHLERSGRQVRVNPEGPLTGACEGRAPLSCACRLAASARRPLTCACRTRVCRCCVLQGVSDVAWSSDSRYICSGSDDKTVKVWDVNEVRAASTAALSGAEHRSGPRVPRSRTPLTRRVAALPAG
jgi:hypothetical protein